MPSGSVTDASEFDGYIENYDAACERGVRLSGEHRDYFARMRVTYTAKLCPDATRVRSVLDFGCGLGHTTPYLAEAFPHARILGMDTAARTVEAAQEHYGNQRIEFRCGLLAGPHVQVDLAYCNGVFHHIPPVARCAEAQQVYDALAPGGWFAFWENNPWNLGTRMVMRRIPFDRDAVPLSPLEARRLLRFVGFRLLGTRSYFYFPAFLRRLRSLEPLLERAPLGAQYCVFALKPGATN